MMPQVKRRLIRTLITVATLMFLSLRIFASVVLNEPFLGDTISSWYDGEQKKEINDPKVLEELNKYSFPISSANNMGQFTDLHFLDSVMSNKEVIGMGEATHGTRDFFQMKHRMFSFLVTRHNYRIFAIEADFAACQRINEYITKGTGDPKQALAQNGYTVWYTEEIMDLIHWMRAYNQDRADSLKLRFWGFDMQQAGPAYAFLRDYFRKAGVKVDSSLLHVSIQSTLKKIKPDQLDSMNRIWLSRINQLHSYYTANKDLLVESSSISSYDLGHQMIQNIKAFHQKLSLKDFNTSYNFRDSCMAVNVLWIKQFEPNSKIMLWGHNGHIANDQWDVQNGNPPAKWMGKHLKNALGNNFYNVGFLFHEGGVTARKAPGSTFTLMVSFIKSMFRDEPWKIDSAYVMPYRKNHLSALLARAEAPKFYLHKNSIHSSSTLANHLDQLHNAFFIGAAFISPSTSIMEQNFWQAYDGLIFMNKVSAARNYSIGTYGNQ